MEENTEHKGWFGRNWKWAVPTGGCLLIIILFVVFAGTMFIGVTSIFTDSEPYKEALANAQSNELVIQALGEPIETSGMIKGGINYNNGEGHTNLDIPIKGPKGAAVLHVVADKYTEVWEYQLMEVTIKETGEIIPLLLEGGSSNDF
ncbi:MAG: cytochrome c oxidase assembly factor 1 family protein [Altibacter sp.]|uniref:cytochrome c oxidase assembly factor Coa1 family protein n=1 Tax=Altibacter sp. TaxID=2024823 RepID=UPI001D2CDAE1|nr:cytochrome c oxidase assembly factor Coa1 family protein [Altibacter sp.]MBZ0327616.1 cytochrome c oxidase assembly factor 1 family protein [Altibacter sp.]